MATRTKATSDAEARGLREGYRSGLEEGIAAALAAAGVPVEYESTTVYYTPPTKQRRYTPDFILPNGIVIETKGRFVTADRQKHRVIQAAHPDLDIRFVFSNPKQRISKTSRTTYAAWCERYGFKYAKAEVPAEWINEPPSRERIAAIYRASEK